MRQRGTVMMAAVLALALAACGKAPASKASATPDVLSFSILSAESQQATEPQWQPLIDDMQKQTGLKVKPFFASNYTTLIEAMRFNQVQLGWFSSVPSIRAIDRSNAEVLGQFVLDDGKPGYKSILIVRKDSGITLDDVLACGMRYSFGIGDAESTSGTLAPLYYVFTPRGITPADCFKTVRSASHQANLGAVANGLVDIATNNTQGLVFAARTPQGRAMVDRIKVIWSSPYLPESGVLARKDLDPAVIAKVRAFFANYGKAAGPEGDHERTVMAGLGYSRFEPSDGAYLDPVRAMMDSNALALARQGGDAAKIAAARKALADDEARMAARGTPSPQAAR